MKKIRKNIKMIIGIILGVIISGVTSYAVAATLINSKDVVYQDNMSIGATNVQNAIDGTCSKIDTRLSTIEDNLYTAQKIYKEISFNSAVGPSYSGGSVTLPAKSYCSLTAKVDYSNYAPQLVSFSKSTSKNDAVSVSLANTSGDITMKATTTYSTYTDSSITLYLWTYFSIANQPQTATIEGFCVSKYK